MTMLCSSRYIRGSSGNKKTMPDNFYRMARSSRGRKPDCSYWHVREPGRARRIVLGDVFEHLGCVTVQQITQHGSRARKRSVATCQELLLNIADVAGDLRSATMIRSSALSTKARSHSGGYAGGGNIVSRLKQPMLHVKWVIACHRRPHAVRATA
jgi:hypothetical protein